MADVIRSSEIEALMRAVDSTTPRMTVPAPPSPVQSEIDDVLLVGGQPARSPKHRVASSLTHDRIEACPGCEAILDLPAVVVGQPTETWRCFACGAVVLTSTTSGNVPPETAQRAFREAATPLGRLATSHDQGLEELVRRAAVTNYLGRECRNHPRFDISLPAIGIPLDASRRVAAPPIRLTTKDLSLTGLSLFCEASVATPLVLVDFTPAGMHGWQAPVRIIRRQATGFLHEFGGEFVTG